MLRFLAAILVPLIVCTGALARSGGASSAIVCTVNQLMDFHDAVDNPPPDDRPAEGAVLGTGREGVRKSENIPKKLGLDARLQDVVNADIDELYGAQFSVDLDTGVVKSIPFGSLKRLAIQDALPKKSDYAKVFAPRYVSEIATHYSVGYFDKSTKLFRGLLLIDPARIGTRAFRYMDLGQMLFGVCL